MVKYDFLKSPTAIMWRSCFAKSPCGGNKMKNKQWLFLIIATFTLPSYALSPSDCARLFSTSGCKSYTVSNNMCYCGGCSVIIDSITTAPDGTKLLGLCGDDNPGGGTVTCKKCNTTTNPCITGHWEINGQLYCLVREGPSQCATDTHATYSVTASQCCQNGYGLNETNATQCVITACQMPFGPNKWYNACNACATGYYSIHGNEWIFVTSADECKKCPTLDGANATTDIAAQDITACRIPTYATMSDSTGTYSFTSECPYTK